MTNAYLCIKSMQISYVPADFRLQRDISILISYYISKHKREYTYRDNIIYIINRYFNYTDI